MRLDGMGRAEVLLAPLAYRLEGSFSISIWSIWHDYLLERLATDTGHLLLVNCLSKLLANL